MKVLIAEDDPVTLESVDACLRSDGFSTITAGNGRRALELWKLHKPDFVCLDIMMPEVDGYEVCRTIRAIDKMLPVLFLSAKNEEIDVVVGLELGADDFIRKPFGKRELLARVRSVLRRAEAVRRGARAPTSFEIGGGTWTIFPTQLRAVHGVDKRELDLTPREVSILSVLHEHRGDAVHRDELHDRCWEMDYLPESRTLDQHIANLRKRIEENPAEPRIIETVRGVGYRLRA